MSDNLELNRRRALVTSGTKGIVKRSRCNKIIKES